MALFQADALPIWVAASGLAGDWFRALVIGPGFGMSGAALLRAMARVLAGAGEGEVSKDEVTAARAQLAAAMGGWLQIELRDSANVMEEKPDWT